MPHLRVDRDGELTILTMARGKANALNRELIEELHAAIAGAVADDSVRGLVLASGLPRFFCAGFDVREVFAYDRDQMGVFFGRFIDVYESLFTLPKPVVAALSGHTFAGGAILAIACDFRIMAEGDYGFALNEINLGLAVTPTILRMLVGAAGQVWGREILLCGESLTPARALEIGLVRELAPAEQVRARAIAWARTLAAKPAAAFRASKRMVRGEDPPADRAVLAGFLDMWFSSEAQEARKAVLAKM